MNDVRKECGALEQLLKEIQEDLDTWNWEDDDDETGPDLAGTYSARIDRIGRTRTLGGVFTCYRSSMGTSLLLHLSFLWNNMSYAEWLTVLTELPEVDNIEIRAIELSYFKMFFSGYLAIDFFEAIETSEQFSHDFKQFVRRSAGPRLSAPLFGHADDVLQNHGIDCYALWRRLAAEGAPMLLSDEELHSGHEGAR